MTNPILAFSAKRRMRSIRTPLLITLFTVVQAGLALLMVYLPFLGESIFTRTMRTSVYGYIALLAVLFGLLILVAPAMTAGSISGERERQTLDLLLVTNTSPTQIVFGKLLESFGFLALLILSSMPMLSLVLLTGGATLTQMLTGLLFLLVTAFGGLSVGLFCSAFVKRTVSATVSAYLMILCIGIVTLVPLWHDVRQMDMLYREISDGSQMEALKEFFSIAFSINPGLGLLAIIQGQTGMLSDFLWSFSNTLASSISYLPLDRYVTVNMCFMAALSLALCLAAVWRVRYRKIKTRKGKVRE